MNNQLTTLDVSKNTKLTDLWCFANQLTALDVSQNTALTRLFCDQNQLTALDVSKNTALKLLSCSSNQLTALDVSKNTALTDLSCYQNQIKDEAMDALVASLPALDKGELNVVYNENEGNVMTTEQATAAKSKGWTSYYFTGEIDERNEQIWQEYVGRKP